TNSATNNTASPFSTLSTDKIGPLSPTVAGQYDIRVTNFITQCFTDANVQVIQKTIPMSITSVTPTHRDLCSALNGAGLIAGITETPGPGNTANYTYTWSTSATMAPTFGLVNDPLTNRGGLDFGTYFVTAKRNAVVSPATPGVTGSGCVTAPATFEVLDKRVSPTVTFATVSSTSCDSNFDGKITVTASTASGPGAGANYNFVWTNDPDGAGAAYSATNSATNNTASPFSTLSTDKIGPLSPTVAGQYDIRVTNFITQCFTDAKSNQRDHTMFYRCHSNRYF
ncbi:MAG: hypothetical protein HYR67_14205, partial [Bacteroidetes bacterium]|nr:hypothetical protein [Bacteroidota bacterium]